MKLRTLLIEVLKPAWRGLASLAPIIVLASVLPLANLWVLRAVIDAVVPAAHRPADSVLTSHLYKLLWLWAGLGIATALTSALQNWLVAWQSQTVTDRVQDIVEARSAAMDLSYYDGVDFHDAVYRAQQQAGYRASQLVSASLGAIQSTLLLLALVIMLVAVAPMAVCIIALVAVPGLVIRLLAARRAHSRSVIVTPLERRAYYLHHLIAGSEAAKEVRLFGLGDVLLDRARQTRAALSSYKMRTAAESGGVEAAVYSLASVGMVGATAWLARQTMAGALSAGSLVMVWGVLQRCVDTLRSLQSNIGTLAENTLFLRSLVTFLDLPARHHVPDAPLDVGPLSSGIRFEGVSFRYPQSVAWALREVTADLPSGARIALVGENGSGKSTFVKLLCRLYDADEGRITWNGVDVRDCRRDDMQARTSVVFQDPIRYHMSLAENIWLGDVALSTTDPRIREAAKFAGLSDVIMRLPRGLDSVLGRTYFAEGEELSVGQWQKVALARASLRSASLVVLDEPTSALDPEAEANMLSAFLSLSHGKTTVFVSHRLSSVRMADLIYVLDKGSLAESGTHDELVSRGGIYARMFEAQSRHYHGPRIEDAIRGASV